MRLIKYSRYNLLLTFLFLSTVICGQTAEPNTGALIQMSSFYPTSGHEKLGYLYIDTQGSVLTELKLTLYNDAMKLNQLSEMDLLPFVKDTQFTNAQVIEFPITLYDGNVYRLTYTYSEQAPQQSPYYEEITAFDYMSDLACTYKTNWGSVGIDKPVEGNTLNITEQIYKKGFGIHAVGWLDCSIPLGKYDRFVTDVGKQSGRQGTMEFALKMNKEDVIHTGAINQSKQIHWDFPIKEISNIHIDILTANDGNGSDHGSIGAPRLYYSSNNRKSQTINWETEQRKTHSKPFKLTLDATVSSGLEPKYRIIQGNEFANLENDSILNIHNLPDKDSIVVAAYQPGNHEWAPTEVKQCIFRLTKGRIVQKDERIELEDGENLNELIVYADANSCGQVSVKNGISTIKKLILKYTFIPKAWNFITFPSDLNIDKISNLNELGYYQNGKVTGQGAYYIRSYDTQSRAETPTTNNWKELTIPTVTGLKGYTIGINDALGMESREVTFTIDNVTLNFESSIRLLNLTLNMTNVEPYSEQVIYVSPANVKGNTLKVAVTFNPEDPTALPINFERALKEARITYTPNRSGIRLTLPDSTPAKIAIYDRKMKKMIKAVRYVSPMMIDISDLESGIYQVIISYGNAIDLKQFTK